MNFDQLPELYDGPARPTLPVNADDVPARPLSSTRLEDEEPDGGEVTIRPARMPDDWEFIEELQKPVRRNVGWWTPKTIEGYIRKDGVLIAERARDAARPEELGLILFADTYRRQENLGVIYHVNVKPVRKRKLIGARLVQEAFARSPYGVRLFCCWCAQDLPANYFWESLGFVPLAFRTGSRKDERIHIFWQRRIREGDTDTPYWYPFNTTGGQLNEQRLVLPLPPGTRWQDAKPAVLPDVEIEPAEAETTEEVEPAPVAKEPAVPGSWGSPAPATLAEFRAQEQAYRASQYETKKVKKRVSVVRGGKVRHEMVEVDEITGERKKSKRRKKARRRKEKPVKSRHPREHVKLSRELRDRYLEAVNDHAAALPPAACGKWDVSRALGTGEAMPESAAADGVQRRLIATDAEIIDGEFEVREAA